MCLEPDCTRATITPLMLYCSEHNEKYVWAEANEEER